MPSLTESDDSDDGDSNWQRVTTNKTNKRNLQRSPNLHQHKKQRTSSTDEPSTSSNKYALLSNDDNKGNEVDKVNEVNEDVHEEMSLKPPPIFIPEVENINKMVKSISKIITANEFNYKSLMNDQIKIMVKSVDSYRKLVKHLESAKIFFHTYQLKQERSYRVVIKGIHHSYPIQDLKAILLSLGHDVRNITNVKSRGSKQPLSMFFVDLDPKANNKDIFNIRHIEKAIVKIEPPQKSYDLIQCHRCQMFGHTKAYCKRPYRCVKCGMDHSTAQCTKNAETPPQCTNCLDKHTANYKGCRIYQQLWQKRFQNNVPAGRHPNYQNNPPDHTFYNKNPQLNSNQQYQNTNPLYSEVVQTTNPSNSFMSKIEAMFTKQMELTNTLISMMSTLINKLCN